MLSSRPQEISPPIVKEATLPPPDAAGQAHCRKVSRRLRELIQRDGPLRFDRYWDEVLYAPGLGYYAAGATKFGTAGDFVTAPELGPVFARCVATQLAEVMAAAGTAAILELGAGSGAFAAAVLPALAELGCPPQEYLILERSASLVQRQRERLAGDPDGVGDRVRWIQALPERFCGAIFGNEVADALAPRRVAWNGEAWTELHVAACDEGFRWHPADLPEDLTHATALIDAGWGEPPEGPYRTEIQTALRPWAAALAASLERGALFLVDYGYPRSEYYHPQRSDGTLICHYRHRAHADPFRYPGLTDLSVSVEFSALREASAEAGLEPAGFTTQTWFLAACGLENELDRAQSLPAAERLARLAEIKRLTLPAEMGERFNAFAAVRGIAPELTGFSLHNRLDRL